MQKVYMVNKTFKILYNGKCRSNLREGQISQGIRNSHFSGSLLNRLWVIFEMQTLEVRSYIPKASRPPAPHLPAWGWKAARRTEALMLSGRLSAKKWGSQGTSSLLERPGGLALLQSAAYLQMVCQEISDHVKFIYDSQFWTVREVFMYILESWIVAEQ